MLRLLAGQNFCSRKIDPFNTALETQAVAYRLLNIINRIRGYKWFGGYRLHRMRP